MKLKHLSIAAASLVLALTVSNTAFVDRAEAYQCKTTKLWGNGVHKRKPFAAAAARAEWTANARSQFGLPWSVLKIAKNKKKECKRWSQDRTKWHCLIEAEPCKYVVQ